MIISKTPLQDLLIIQPAVFEDSRGYFFESFNQKKLAEGIPIHWVQDNESKSQFGVLRGLHYQYGPHAQAKLVRVVVGEVYDVAVDIRPNSPTYKQWFGIHLSEENKTQMYVPRGFAHGFLVLSESAVFSYKCDNYYSFDHQGGIRFDDPELSIDWLIPSDQIILAEKDKINPLFKNHIPV